MKRIVYKYWYDGERYGSKLGTPCDDLDYLELVYNKLGQLEDYEEEMNVNFLTLVKAVELNKVYVRYNNEYRKCRVKSSSLRRDENGKVKAYLTLRIIQENIEIEVAASEYNKTWAFTKNRLKECEKKN